MGVAKLQVKRQINMRLGSSMCVAEESENKCGGNVQVNQLYECSEAHGHNSKRKLTHDKHTLNAQRIW